MNRDLPTPQYANWLFIEKMHLICDNDITNIICLWLVQIINMVKQTKRCAQAGCYMIKIFTKTILSMRQTNASIQQSNKNHLHCSALMYLHLQQYRMIWPEVQSFTPLFAHKQITRNN